jgi:ribosomal protein S18 acetylase RimI-like enzyme
MPIRPRNQYQEVDVSIDDAPEGKLTIRDARLEELDDVALLIKAAYRQYKPLMPADGWRFYEQSMGDVRSRLGEAQLIVAELNRKLAGTVTLYLERSATSLEGWPDGWGGIRLLAVLPKFRGHGIGRALMEECLRRCRSYGLSTVGLHTTEMMAVALRMYEKMGFKRVPELDFHPRPDVVVMAYRLVL